MPWPSFLLLEVARDGYGSLNRAFGPDNYGQDSSEATMAKGTRSFDRSSYALARVPPILPESPEALERLQGRS